MLWYNLGVTFAAQGHLRTDEGKFYFLRAVDAWKMALQIEPRWRKPAEDLQRLIKILLDNKVITTDVNKANTGMPVINIPMMGGGKPK